MKKYTLCLLVIFVSSAIVWADNNEWHILKSTHFIAHYKNAPEDFVEEVIERSEGYYNDIAENLGFRRYNFWLWENRAKIYIHDDSYGYQAATGQPSWSSGLANVKDKIIHTFPYAKGFFDTILPHELGHIIFREFVGFDNPALPLWLDEGVASYQEILSRKSIARKTIAEALKNNKFLSLEKLSQFNPHSTQDNELVNLFYSEAVSVVDFLIEEFGDYKFVRFCQTLRDKKNFAEALASNYPFKNISELDKAWQDYLREGIGYGAKRR